MKLAPDMQYNIDSNMLTVITVFFYVLFVITSQGAAAVATVLAAISTLLWNVYKFLMDRKDRRRADIERKINHIVNQQSDE